MIGIVVTGHGHFPSGLLSAIELVAGKPENVAAVDFEGGQSQADLQTALDAAIRGLEGDEVLGGTPFNTASTIREQIPGKQVKVLAGINMAGMVEAVFSRAMADFGQLAGMVAEAAHSGIVNLENLEGPGEEPEFEDGLNARSGQGRLK